MLDKVIQLFEQLAGLHLQNIKQKSFIAVITVFYLIKHIKLV